MLIRFHLLVKVYSVGHDVDMFKDLIEAKLILDDALFGRLNQCNADNLDH